MFAERQGLHPRVLQPLRGVYRELRRRFVMAGHVGKEFVASNGVIHSESASAEPPHEHLGQISESRDHNSNAKSVCGDTTAKTQRRHNQGLGHHRNLYLNGGQLDFVSKLEISWDSAQTCKKDDQ